MFDAVYGSQNIDVNLTFKFLSTAIMCVVREYDPPPSSEKLIVYYSLYVNDRCILYANGNSQNTFFESIE